MRSQVTTGPDRLVLDFPNALPGSDLHNQTINRGGVNGIRVGLFSQNPPVTRVVIDLKSAQQYRIYPSGKTVLVKLWGNPPSDQKPLGLLIPAGMTPVSSNAWVVTVDAPPQPNVLGEPTTATVFTDVIDAVSGAVIDSCAGCRSVEG